jgi:hypothetical protein
VPHAVEIGRSADHVFTYLAELHDAEWRSGVTEMRLLSDTAHAVGARHVEVRKVPGRMVESEAEVVEYERPVRLAFRRASGPVRPQVTYDVAPLGDGRCKVTAAMSVPVAPAVAGPILRLVLDATLGRELRKLRTAVEATD